MLHFASAVVRDNVDETGKGIIKVSLVDEDPSMQKIYTAYPIFQVIGNEAISSGEAHMGTYFVPPVGSLVAVLYDTSRSGGELYYFGCLLPRQDKSALPESSLQDAQKRAVLFRSSTGQSIVISQSDNDRGVRITGSKRQYDRTSPGGSVVPVKGNQSSIVIDDKNDEIHIYSLKAITLYTDGGYIRLDSSGNLTIKVKTYSLSFSSGVTSGGSLVENVSAVRSGCRCGGKAAASNYADCC